MPHSQDPSRPIGTLSKPDFTKKMPILWKAWIRSPDHSSSPKVSNFSSEAAAEVSALPLPAPGVDTQEVPHGTHVALLGRLIDVLASGMTRAQPLGSCWKVARLVNTNTRVDTPSRMGKPETKEPSALHGFCSFSGLGMRMAKQISRRKISNA